jgi:phosphatidylserine/phosphatidylglycerophosphate/cardiolipin synthase-like enzyme
MARVPTLRLYVLDGSRPLHAKRAVFDGEMTLVGTYNLDPLSETMNSEMAVLVHSPFFAQAALRQIVGRRSDPDVIEYKIARGDDGEPLRDRHGKVVQLKGPSDHVPPARLAQLHELKQALLDVEGFFDFKPAVW